MRVTAYVLRAVETFKSKRASQGSSPHSTEELADAECRWIEDSQMTLNCELIRLLEITIELVP